MTGTQLNQKTHGWRIDYQNIKIEESRRPGRFWSLNDYPGAFGILRRYCIEPQGAPVITVTLPDGEVERFETAASPTCNDAVPLLDVSLVFNAVGDTQSELEALNDTSARYVLERGSSDLIEYGQGYLWC